MDLISVAIEPRGPIITGEEGRWLSAQRWINMHNVLLAANCVGPDRDMLIPPAPVEAVLLLRDGSIVPFSGYEPHESEVVASSGEGYQVWAPLPPAAERSTGGPVVAGALRWDVVLGAQSVRITLHTGVQLEVGLDGCTVLAGDPASVNLYPLFEDGVLAGEANQVTIFHKGNLLLVCSELWAYACNIGPMAPVVSAGAVITPSVESPVGNDLWAALASAASIRLASMVVTAEAVQVSGQLITPDLVFSDDVDDNGEVGGAEGADDLSGQSLRGTLLELLALDSSIDLLKQQLAHALAALNTARDELTAKSEELVTLQLAIAALQGGQESLNQRLLLLEQAPKCCCRCCGQETCSCGCGSGTGTGGDSGSGGDANGDPFQTPDLGTEDANLVAPDSGLPPEIEGGLDRVIPPELKEEVDPGLGRPQPVPPEWIDAVLGDDELVDAVIDNMVIMVQLPWLDMYAHAIEAAAAEYVSNGWWDNLERGDHGTVGAFESLYLYNQVTGELDYSRAMKYCWHDIIDTFGICIPFKLSDIRTQALKHGVEPDALLTSLKALTPRTDVATWWAAFWQGVRQFDTEPSYPHPNWHYEYPQTDDELNALQSELVYALLDKPSDMFDRAVNIWYAPDQSRIAAVVSAFILVFAEQLLDDEMNTLIAGASWSSFGNGELMSYYETNQNQQTIVELGLRRRDGLLQPGQVPPHLDWVLNAVAAEAKGLLAHSPSASAVTCTDLIGEVLGNVPPRPEDDTPSTMTGRIDPLLPRDVPPNPLGFVQMVVGNSPGSSYNRPPAEIWPGSGAYWNNAHGSQNRIPSPYLQG